jgi:hypothetical protein
MATGIEVREGKRGKVYRAHVWSNRDQKTHPQNVRLTCCGEDLESGCPGRAAPGADAGTVEHDAQRGRR